MAGLQEAGEHGQAVLPRLRERPPGLRRASLPWCAHAQRTILLCSGWAARAAAAVSLLAAFSGTMWVAGMLDRFAHMMRQGRAIVCAGGPVFNPAGMAKGNDDATKTMRTKELKNGRLAMIAMLGFASQACMTGKGPIANLADHIKDPFNNNLIANLSKLGGSA